MVLYGYFAMLLTHIISTLFPIIAIVLVGYIYAKHHPIDMSLANRLNTDIFIPALLFSVLSDKSFQLMEYQSLMIAAICVVLGSGLIAYPITRLLRLNVRTFLPTMMFTNSGNMGIPVLLFAFGEQALQIAVILFVVENTLHFSVGMYLVNRHTKLWSFLRTPMIVSTFAGLFVSSANIHLPTTLIEPIHMLGQIAVPLMLFALGVRLLDIDFSGWRVGVLGALLCPLSGLLIFVLWQQWGVPLEPLQLSALLIFSILPPAVLNYIIAEQYQQEPETVAFIVLMGNLVSLISLPLALSYIMTYIMPV